MVGVLALAVGILGVVMFACIALVSDFSRKIRNECKDLRGDITSLRGLVREERKSLDETYANLDERVRCNTLGGKSMVEAGLALSEELDAMEKDTSARLEMSEAGRTSLHKRVNKCNEHIDLVLDSMGMEVRDGKRLIKVEQKPMGREA